MSRSRKKPYVKDKGFRKEDYWRTIRREWKQDLNQNWDDPDLLLRKPQEIINDYDYCDYWFYVEVEKSKDLEKYSRK